VISTYQIKLKKAAINFVVNVVITCFGTSSASIDGMSLGLVKTFSWLSTDPDRTFTKKTFHMLKDRILQHALLFLPLREIDPSIEEKSIINGGTVYNDSNKTTLGRYPVITLAQNDLNKKIRQDLSHNALQNLSWRTNAKFLYLLLHYAVQDRKYFLKLLQLHHTLNKRDRDKEHEHEDNTSCKCRYFPKPNLSVGDPEV
jgi:hypothetical protein